jgi:hypothetical protein
MFILLWNMLTRQTEISRPPLDQLRTGRYDSVDFAAIHHFGFSFSPNHAPYTTRRRTHALYTFGESFYDRKSKTTTTNHQQPTA